jgi:hypothetical protein
LRSILSEVEQAVGGKRTSCHGDSPNCLKRLAKWLRRGRFQAPVAELSPAAGPVAQVILASETSQAGTLLMAGMGGKLPLTGGILIAPTRLDSFSDAAPELQQAKRRMI